MPKLFAAHPITRYSALGLLMVSVLCVLVVINFNVTRPCMTYAHLQAALPHFDHVVVAES